MIISEKSDKLFAALFTIQNQGLMLRKNKTASIVSDKGKYNYDYANLNAVLDAISDPLRDAGLLLLWGTPILTSDTPKFAVGTTLRIVHVESGQFVESTRYMPVHEKATPQGVGSAMSYLRRYLLLEAFNLTADDDDGKRASQQPGDKAPARRQVPPKSKADDPRQYLVKLIGEWSGVAAEDRVSAARSARPLLSKKLNLPASDWTPEQVDTAVKFVQDQITRGYDFSEWMAAMAL